MRRSARTFIVAANSVAVAGAASLIAYAIYARSIVGHWPSYGRPDPKDLDLPLIHSIVGIGFLASITVPLIATTVLAVVKATSREAAFGWRDVSTAAGLWLAIMFLWNTTGWGGWYLD